MKKASLLIFSFVTFLSWSLPCEGWDVLDFPPAGPDNVIAASYVSAEAGLWHKERLGLGKWNAGHSSELGTGGCLTLNNTNFYNGILVNFKAGGVVEPYTEIFITAIGRRNFSANHALIDYTYVVKPRRVGAPMSIRVPVVVKAQIIFKMNYCSPSLAYDWGTYSAAYAQIFLYDSEHGLPKNPIVFESLSPKDYPLSKKVVNQEIVNDILPQEIRNVRLYAKCILNCAYPCEISRQKDECYTLIDPIITIDPNFMVEIDGLEYPANEVYDVVYSDALTKPPEPTPVLPHILPLLLDE